MQLFTEVRVKVHKVSPCCVAHLVCQQIRSSICSAHFVLTPSADPSSDMHTGH